jgi:peptidoglycan/xylan/chitin deacetylase (PgdA/CDA1 family)
VLIFNFHHIEKTFRHPSRKMISMTPEGLRQFIRTLRLAGRKIVSLRDVLQDFSPARLNDNRYVVLTFDDGYVNNLEQALPILEQERCPATIFVLPGRFSGTNEWDQSHLPEAERDQLLSREQMHRLCQSPYITLGSHGLTHVRFPTLSDEDLRIELQESHRILSETFPQSYLPVLAYPWGDYDERVVSMMADTPYQAAFTVETRPCRATDDPYRIPRFSAYERDGNPVVLLAKLFRHNLLMP